MKKSNLFRLGMLVALLTFGLVLTGCDNGDDGGGGDNNPFLGTWTGTATDPSGDSAQAIAVFTQNEWTVLIPLARISENGTYTHSGNTATVFINGDNVGTSTISGGTLVASVRGLGTATLTKRNPSLLTVNRWTNGAITANTDFITYSFNAVNGTTYYIWTNDGYDGDGSKTLDTIFWVFDDNERYGYGDDHWETPFVFTASSNGRVSIVVCAYSPPQTGTFAIAYSTSRTRP